MNLAEATALLGSHARNFSDVYKLYNYRDDNSLKDYLDFIIHEPIEWIKGFPPKLVSKGSFPKPKTALVKLLKQQQVMDILGEPYTKRVHEIVWTTFKQHGDAILERRMNRTGINGTIVAQLECESVGSAASAEEGIEESDVHLHIENELIRDTDSHRSVRLSRVVAAAPAPAPAPPAGCNWEQKYRVLETAYRALVTEYQTTCPGVVSSLLTLLDALGSSSQ